MAMLYGFGVHVMLIWLFWQPQIAVLEHRAILYYVVKSLKRRKGGWGSTMDELKGGKSYWEVWIFS